MADEPKDDVTTDETPVEPSSDESKEGVEEKVEDVSIPETPDEPTPGSEEKSEDSESILPADEAVSASDSESSVLGSETTKDESSEEGYQFDDDLSSSEPSQAPDKGPASAGTGGGKYADEVFTRTIHAKFRTFYVDLKESVNGKFLKISEKSRGRKSTIMMDAEDVPAMIEALQEVQKQM